MPNPSNIQAPIFIGGSGRSGTTWGLNNLGRHPEVQAIVETTLAYSIYREMQDSWWADEFLRTECGGKPEVRESRTISTIHEALCAAFPSDRKRWVMKIIWGVESCFQVPISFWRKAFPGAIYIHCMRNPLETLSSMIGYMANLTDLAAAERGFITGHRDMLELRSQGVPYFPIRLEDVASDPVSAWRSLREFCRLPEFPVPHSVLNQPAATRASLAGDSAGPSLSWSDLSPRALEISRRLGYRVPPDCPGRSENSAVVQPSNEELAQEIVKLGARNSALREQVLALEQRLATHLCPPQADPA